MDIDIDMTISIRKQHTEGIALNLIQQSKNECLAAVEREKAKLKQKEKWFKENWKLN